MIFLSPTGGRTIVSQGVVRSIYVPKPFTHLFMLVLGVNEPDITDVHFTWVVKNGTRYRYEYGSYGTLIAAQKVVYTTQVDLSQDIFQPAGGYFFNLGVRPMLINKIAF
jgi:hypothetical protein